MPLALALSLCAGCASGGFERGAGALFCPALVAYPPEFSAQLAAETARLPEDSAILRALLDYAVLRDQVRACENILRRSKTSSGHR